MTSPKDLLVQGINYPWRLVSGRLAKGEAISVSDLSPGQGRVLRVRGEKLAVYRDVDQGLQAVSPICTHLGCAIEFNDGDRTWDCPCHGSRFRPDGTVLRGPAKEPLESKRVEEAGS